MSESWEWHFFRCAVSHHAIVMDKTTFWGHTYSLFFCGWVSLSSDRVGSCIESWNPGMRGTRQHDDRTVTWLRTADWRQTKNQNLWMSFVVLVSWWTRRTNARGWKKLTASHTKMFLLFDKVPKTIDMNKLLVKHGKRREDGTRGILSSKVRNASVADRKEQEPHTTRIRHEMLWNHFVTCTF